MKAMGKNLFLRSAPNQAGIISGCMFFFTRMILIPVIFAGAFHCKKESNHPSEKIIQAYQKNAHIFCNAVVECFKEDAKIRLKNNPERAELISSKMDLDLCQQNQYRLIGQTSVSIKESIPSSNDELYKSYENCALAVSSEKECKARFEIYKTHPDCLKIKQN